VSRSAIMAALLAIVLMSDVVGADVARAQTVLVDVGHSRRSPGSTSASGIGEFEFNRLLAAEVSTALRRRGVTVVMPNADGATTGLAARPAAAAAARADLFLSIHHDAIQSRFIPWRDRFGGFSVWSSGSHPQAAASARCATSIGRSMLSGGMRPALFHAERVEGEGRILLDPTIARYRRDDLAVLRLSRTPAVLVEAGVIVNPAEEAWLSRPDVRAGIAERIAEGAVACIRR
jgi:N-acetylmuramoyl-L-alanine amidase